MPKDNNKHKCVLLTQAVGASGAAALRPALHKAAGKGVATVKRVSLDSAEQSKKSLCLALLREVRGTTCTHNRNSLRTHNSRRCSPQDHTVHHVPSAAARVALHWALFAGCTGVWLSPVPLCRWGARGAAGRGGATAAAAAAAAGSAASKPDSSSGQAVRRQGAGSSRQRRWRRLRQLTVSCRQGEWQGATVAVLLGASGPAPTGVIFGGAACSLLSATHPHHAFSPF